MSFSKSSSSKDESTTLGGDYSSSQPGKLEAFIGKGSKIVGNLNFTGPVEINGTVEGEIHAQDRITVGESAIVNAKIVGGEVVVLGTVNGDIVASKRLSLKKPAKILGNITSSNLSIEEGVVFEGKCVMGSAVSSDSKNSGPVKAVTGGAAVKIGASA
jgi:cytoskeletal protein CcmA (bactofilin family)